ncbi:uncharacterized protein BJ212DRAFT_1578158 [Suillus subaureus]|uniref:Uncharacterized protein n=1 Tax=Suillus subaureus TaxID=48587 RepID=A0A9P7E8E7_9AGAM|nr:uncharacterized protein BJ212DRAFT_1578158 [Suillus subaureus]KAG1813988.1 hypothetical protein BJ212DRAFT_1578158 [Suillus subaureus]
MTQFRFTIDEYPRTIYEFDASTLKTVRAPFKGHTGTIISFYDTIKLWTFESRQLLGSFDVQNTPFTLALSPDSRQLVYTFMDDTEIYTYNILANILASIGLAEEPQPSSSKPECSRYVGLPNFPATSPLPCPPKKPDKNSRSTPAPPTTQSSVISASETLEFSLRRLSTWWPPHKDPASLAIVDVPLAPGKVRYATSGAPGDDDDLIHDKDYVSPPPSPNPRSRQLPASDIINAGKHRSGRFCFCF